VEVRRDRWIGINQRGPEVALVICMQQSTNLASTKKGGRQEQRTDKGYDNGGVRWYIDSLSYSVFYVVARSRSLSKFPEKTMRLRLQDRHNLYVGNPRPR